MQSKTKQTTAKNLNLVRHLLKLSLPLILLISSIIKPLISYAQPEPIIIGLTQIVEHPALDQAKQGIIDTLKENGYIDGQNIQIIEKNAQGNMANAIMIAQYLTSIKPKVIVSISTPSTQAVVKAARENHVPVVFSSVTDPIEAKIVQDLNNPTNICGAIDTPPLQEEVALIKKLIPNIKKLGVLYNPGEANSVKTIKTLKAIIGDQMQIVEVSITNSNQISSALNTLVNKVDALYIPSDNTVFSALPMLVKQSIKHQLPVFSSDPDSVKLGVLACIGYSQYTIGRKAGIMLVQILKGENNFKIETPEKYEELINKETAEKLGIKL